MFVNWEIDHPPQALSPLENPVWATGKNIDEASKLFRPLVE
jgi:hypothetical protein